MGWGRTPGRRELKARSGDDGVGGAQTFDLPPQGGAFPLAGFSMSVRFNFGLQHSTGGAAQTGCCQSTCLLPPRPVPPQCALI
jgi:hypothetical protein